MISTESTSKIFIVRVALLTRDDVYDIMKKVLLIEQLYQKKVDFMEQKQKLIGSSDPAALELESFMSVDHLEKPSQSISLIVMISFVWLVLTIAALAQENAVGTFFVIVGPICITYWCVKEYNKSERWHRYLEARQQSLDELQRDKSLYESAIEDYLQTKKQWDRIGVGQKYLFLQGHLPIGYEQISRVEYHFGEQRQTTSGTIPEELGFVVALKNGQAFVIGHLPCPSEQTTPRQGRFGTHYERVSLRRRVCQNNEYMQIPRSIKDKLRNVSEKKSIRIQLTY